jgi:hypothetical protein
VILGPIRIFAGDSGANVNHFCQDAILAKKCVCSTIWNSPPTGAVSVSFLHVNRFAHDFRL